MFAPKQFLIEYFCSAAHASQLTLLQQQLTQLCLAAAAEFSFKAELLKWQDKQHDVSM